MFCPGVPADESSGRSAARNVFPAREMFRREADGGWPDCLRSDPDRPVTGGAEDVCIEIGVQVSGNRSLFSSAAGKSSRRTGNAENFNIAVLFFKK